MKRFIIIGGFVAAGLAVTGTVNAAPSLADTAVVVTPTNTQGWTAAQPTADTRPGGNVTFVADSTAPSGVGALQLTTDSTTAAKAQYVHNTNTPLSSVTGLSYYTKQVTPSPSVADPSYQLATLLNGSSGFTTLVFEPYQNPAQGPIAADTWQKWDVSGGLFWSTHTVTCSNGTIQGTAGGPATYTLSQIQSACPDASVFQFILNIGTNNPGYTVETDLFAFDGTVYDFEPYQVATSKDQCKDDGWMNLHRADGSTFNNQGDCIQYVNTGK